MNDQMLLILLAILAFLASVIIIYPLKRRLISSLLLLPLIFSFAFTAYFHWGSFAKWQDYLQQQEKQQQAETMLKKFKSPQELIDKLREKLDDNPQSAKGWYLLGRLYSGQNERQNAVDAFAKAHELNPLDEQYAVNYAHSLWVLNNRQFSDQIINIFENLLKTNPNQPDALAMLAMNAYAHQAYAEAVSYWQRLLRLVPPQSEEAEAIRKAIAKAETNHF